MASGQSGSSSQQPFAYPHPAPVAPAHHVASPPTKQSLKTWAKWFKAPQKTQETQGNEVSLVHPHSGIANPPSKQKQQKRKKFERKPIPFFPPSIFVDLYLRKPNIPRNLTSVFQEGIMENFSFATDGVPIIAGGVFDLGKITHGLPSAELCVPTTLSETVRNISTRVFGRYSVLALRPSKEDDTPSVDSSTLSTNHTVKGSSSGSCPPPIKRDKVGHCRCLSNIADLLEDQVTCLGQCVHLLPFPRLDHCQPLLRYLHLRALLQIQKPWLNN